MGKMLTLCEVSIDEQAVTQACAELVLYPTRRRRLDTRKVTCTHVQKMKTSRIKSLFIHRMYLTRMCRVRVH